MTSDKLDEDLAFARFRTFTRAYLVSWILAVGLLSWFWSDLSGPVRWGLAIGISFLGTDLKIFTWPFMSREAYAARRRTEPTKSRLFR